jgi:nicotinamidase-related amidase
LFVSHVEPTPWLWLLTLPENIIRSSGTAVKESGVTGSGQALLVVDMQLGFNDRRWGRRNNPGAESQAMRLMHHWRSSGRQVVIVRHDSTDPGSPLFPEHPGNAFKPGFEPCEGDWLIGKRVNSAFIDTELQPRLRAAGIVGVTLVGLTTDQCVSTTARMASNLGFATTVAEDACACFGQTSIDGRKVLAETMHLAHLTTLHSEFARVARVNDLVSS